MTRDNARHLAEIKTRLNSRRRKLPIIINQVRLRRHLVKQAGPRRALVEIILRVGTGSGVRQQSAKNHAAIGGIHEFKKWMEDIFPQLTPFDSGKRSNFT